VDEPALAVRDLGAELLGPLVQAHGIGLAVGANLGLEPLLDGLVDDEEQRGGADAQDQADEFRCLVLGLLGPVAVVLGPELGRVEGAVVVVGAVEPVVDEDVYAEVRTCSECGFGGVSPVYRFGGTRLRAALSSSEYSLS
jgi:hypothetical protein